ncbi:DUF998 domain-containing protein [Methanobacterium subterraneum]|jgi:hypothetical membrane protein|uniref:DUF998 domain-containing protein n=1 Tax=Methanobacterium subterraneum TaxID=59277 RepID=A0A2H4VP06_9EURY|nr:DUF998 domain-containing protein [Methanobacterium subterraneum]AUB59845.1 hypothetical protein BK009_03640 [Methanobacterium subterraneum]MBW4257552.1 DUF998 domain-containing protein [Methanobacterium sp. YSL]NMO09118.1 DUF998 domain-containing protein [Methanobacterium subterraneum]
MKVQNGSIFRPENDFYRTAGILLLIAALQFFMAINLAETQFPGYSSTTDTLSHLGGAIPPIEPSATIFNVSVILLGVLSLASVYLILKSGGCRLFSSCLAISAVGAVGVGLFPSYTGSFHMFFAILTFIFGSLTVLFSYRLGLNIPMVIVSIFTGFTSLTIIISALLWGLNNPIIIYLGLGGAERFVVYPILFYLLAMGGYLTSRGEDWVRIRFTRGYF